MPEVIEVTAAQNGFVVRRTAKGTQQEFISEDYQSALQPAFAFLRREWALPHGHC